MSSAYGKIERPKEYNAIQLEALLPIENQTKSSQLVSVHSLATILEKIDDKSTIVSYLQSLLNTEIEAGNTYPQKYQLNSSQFQDYFLSGDVFVVINGGKILPDGFYQNLEENILGTFYVKPNFPGRCSHICNAGFITSSLHRNKGVGRIMALAFLAIAPLLGYKASMFNLVFESNTPSARLWRSLGFREIGKIPNAGYLRKKTESNQIVEEYVDAIMFYYSFM